MDVAHLEAERKEKKGFFQTKKGVLITSGTLLVGGLTIFATVGYQQGWFSSDDKVKPVSPKNNGKDVTGGGTPPLNNDINNNNNNTEDPGNDDVLTQESTRQQGRNRNNREGTSQQQTTPEGPKVSTSTQGPTTTSQQQTTPPQNASEDAALPDVLNETHFEGLFDDLKNNPNADFTTLQGKHYLGYFIHKDALKCLRPLIDGEPTLRGRVVNLIQDSMSSDLPGLLEPFDCDNPNYSVISWPLIHKLSKKIARIDCLKLERKDKKSFWTSSDVLDIIKTGSEKLKAKMKTERPNMEAMLKNFEKAMDELDSPSGQRDTQHKSLSDVTSAYSEIKKLNSSLVPLMEFVLPIWEVALFEELLNDKLNNKNSEQNATARSIFYSIRTIGPNKLVPALKYDSKLTYEEFLREFPLCPTPVQTQATTRLPIISNISSDDSTDNPEDQPLNLTTGQSHSHVVIDLTQNPKAAYMTRPTTVETQATRLPIISDISSDDSADNPEDQPLILTTGQSLSHVVTDLTQNPKAGVRELQGQAYMTRLNSIDVGELNAVKGLISSHPNLRGRIANLISDYSSLFSDLNSLDSNMRPFGVPNPPYDTISWTNLRLISRKISRIDCLKLGRKDGGIWTAEDTKDLIAKGTEALSKNIAQPLQEQMSEFQVKADAVFTASDKQAAINALKVPFDNLATCHPEVMGENLMRYLASRWELMLYDAQISQDDSLAKDIYESICALDYNAVVNIHKYGPKLPYDEFIVQFKPCTPIHSTLLKDDKVDGIQEPSSSKATKAIEEMTTPAVMLKPMAKAPGGPLPVNIFEELVADLRNDPTANFSTLSEKEYIKYFTHPEAANKLKELVKSNANLRGRIVNLIQDSVSGRIPGILEKYKDDNADYSTATWEEVRDLSKKIMRIDCFGIERSENTLWTTTAVCEVIKKASDVLEVSMKSKVNAVDSEMNYLDTLDDQQKNFGDLNAAYTDLKSQTKVELVTYVIPKWEVKLFKELAKDSSTNGNSLNNSAARRIFYSLRSIPNKPLVFQLKYDHGLTYEEFLTQFPLCPVPSN